MPGLHDDGQWFGTDGHWIDTKGSICAEFSIVTLKENKRLLSYTSFAHFVYFTVFYTLIIVTSWEKVVNLIHNSFMTGVLII